MNNDFGMNNNNNNNNGSGGFPPPPFGIPPPPFGKPPQFKMPAKKVGGAGGGASKPKLKPLFWDKFTDQLIP